MPRTKENRPCGKGGNPIKLSSKKISYSMLNLLEFLLEKKRQSIKVECSKKKIKLSDYEQVALFLKQKLGKKSK